MKKLSLYYILALVSTVAFSQRKDTVIIEYTPKQQTLGNVEIVAKKNPSVFINELYTSEGCWKQLNPGDTIFNLKDGKPDDDLFSFLNRVLPGVSCCDMARSAAKSAGQHDPPRYKGRELGVFLNEEGVNMRKWDEIMRYSYKEKGPVIIKFFQEFSCTAGTGPAIVIYTQLKALRR